MIFVTVGMHHQGFDRLIKAMDQVAANTLEPVVMQIGASTYEPVHALWFRYDTQEMIEAYCAASRVVVGHAGAGTVLSAQHAGRPIVVVPRRSAFREHVDDHQLELAQALAEQNKAVMVLEPTAHQLQKAIAQALSLPPVETPRLQLAAAIQEILRTGKPPDPPAGAP